MSYRDLKTYQTATIIYDFTVKFCEKYIRHYSRTRDQMEQAARSGKQNIVEGSAERASKKSEIKLLGVARASFEELLEDYRDFLRQKNLLVWEKDSQESRAARGLAFQENKSYQTYMRYMENAERACNVMICLINQENFLLDRQIKAVERQFIEQGGYTEQLRNKRIEYRKKSLSYWPGTDNMSDWRNEFNGTDRSDRTDRTDRIDKSDRTDRSDGTNRSDESDWTDRSDKINKTDKTDKFYPTD